MSYIWNYHNNIQHLCYEKLMCTYFTKKNQFDVELVTLVYRCFLLVSDSQCVSWNSYVREIQVIMSPKCKQYSQRFRSEWFADDLVNHWVTPVMGEDTKAYCVYCKCTIRAKYQDLKQHAFSKKHRKALPVKNELTSNSVTMDTGEEETVVIEVNKYILGDS